MSCSALMHMVASANGLFRLSMVPQQHPSARVGILDFPMGFPGPSIFCPHQHIAGSKGRNLLLPCCALVVPFASHCNTDSANEKDGVTVQPFGCPRRFWQVQLLG